MPAAKHYSKLEAVGEQLNDSDLSSGPEDTTSINSGDVGTMAEATVGTDGVLANYEWVSLRQVGKGNDPADKAFIDIENDSNSDADDRTLVRFGARKVGEQGADVSLTPWQSIRTLDKSDPRQRQAFRVQGGGALTLQRDPLSVPVQDGRVLILQLRNEATSVTPNLSNTTLQVPLVGWK